MTRAKFCTTSKVKQDCRHCFARHISLCSHVDTVELVKLQTMSKRYRFERGQVVFEQYDRIDTVFMITHGMAKLYHDTPGGKRQITGFLGPGDLLGSIKRSADAYCTAAAVMDLEVCGFNKKPFLEFLQTHTALCFALLVVAMDEIEAQYDHTILLRKKQPRERLAAFLLLLSQRWKTKDENTNLAHIQMSRGDIADHLGVTSETISRTFTRFKEAGLIQMLDKKSVLLKNVPGLQQLAGFEEMPAHRMGIGL